MPEAMPENTSSKRGTNPHNFTQGSHSQKETGGSESEARHLSIRSCKANERSRHASKRDSSQARPGTTTDGTTTEEKSAPGTPPGFRSLRRPRSPPHGEGISNRPDQKQGCSGRQKVPEGGSKISVSGFLSYGASLQQKKEERRSIADEGENVTGPAAGSDSRMRTPHQGKTSQRTEATPPRASGENMLAGSGIQTSVLQRNLFHTHRNFKYIGVLMQALMAKRSDVVNPYTPSSNKI